MKYLHTVLIYCILTVNAYCQFEGLENYKTIEFPYLKSFDSTSIHLANDAFIVIPEYRNERRMLFFNKDGSLRVENNYRYHDRFGGRGITFADNGRKFLVEFADSEGDHFFYDQYSRVFDVEGNEIIKIDRLNCYSKISPKGNFVIDTKYGEESVDCLSVYELNLKGESKINLQENFCIFHANYISDENIFIITEKDRDNSSDFIIYDLKNNVVKIKHTLTTESGAPFQYFNRNSKHSISKNNQIAILGNKLFLDKSTGYYFLLLNENGDIIISSVLSDLIPNIDYVQKMEFIGTHLLFYYSNEEKYYLSIYNLSNYENQILFSCPNYNNEIEIFAFNNINDDLFFELYHIQEKFKGLYKINLSDNKIEKLSKQLSLRSSYNSFPFFVIKGTNKLLVWEN